MSEKIHWGEMTRVELKKLAEKTDTVLLPVGSTEQHGPHLPVDTDTFDAKYILEKACELLPDPKPPILPVIPYGVSGHHMGFDGTITLRDKTLHDIVVDIGRSVWVHGFKKMIIYNAHGGNTAVLRTAANTLKKDPGLRVFMDSGQSMEKGKKELVKSVNDVHAGEYETSTSLANRKELVDIDSIEKPELTFPHPSFEFNAEAPYFFNWNTDELTSTGVIGDPTVSNEEKGDELWERGIKTLSKRIKIILKL